MNLNGATHDRYDSNPPPTERDPQMAAPETLIAIGRELTAVGEHVANVERQMGSFRQASWEEQKEQAEKLLALQAAQNTLGEKLSELRIDFHRFHDDATQTMEITKGLCERILAKLSKA